MVFLIAVQGPEGQGAWAEQYDSDLKPVKARTHEPAGYVVRESLGVLELLARFYQMTGNRRYLAPIPRCLNWLERVQRESEEADRPLARYYEPGTNAPIYCVMTEKTDDRGFGVWEWTADPSKLPSDSGRRQIDVSLLRREYERLAALSANELRTAEPVSYLRQRRRELASAEEIVQGLDSRGAWVGDVRVMTTTLEGLNPGTFEFIRGISTMTFVRNMEVLISELKE
jgi:hypothetical protein